MGHERVHPTTHKDLQTDAVILPEKEVQIVGRERVSEGEVVPLPIELVLGEVVVIQGYTPDVNEVLRTENFFDLDLTSPGEKALEKDSPVPAQKYKLDKLPEKKYAAIETDDFKERIQRGDPQAIEYFVNFIHNPAISYAMRLLRNPELAEDALQDVYERIIKNVANFVPSLSLGSWFFTILTNRCFDLLRQKAGRKTTPLTDLENDTGEYTTVLIGSMNSHALVAEAESVKDLHTFLDQLPTIYKAPLLLSSEGYSIREIASITTIPESTVRSRLQNGRKLAKRKKAEMKIDNK